MPGCLFLVRLAGFLGLLAEVVVSAPATWSSGLSVQPRQYWPDPTKEPIPSEEECILESFSSPKWGIYDPALITVNGSSGGSMGDIRFLTMNTATGLVANCTANNIELDPKGLDALEFWHNCSVPNLFFQFNLTSFELRLKGTWTCGESKLRFAANGTWEEPLIQGCLDDWEAPRGQEILCIMGNSQVWGGLSSPVNITPQLPLLPYTPQEPPWRCVDRSVDPQWQISNMLYQQDSLENHYNLSLDLLNLSNNEIVVCNVTVDQSRGIANKDGSVPWVDCRNTAKNNITSTSIMFDTINGLLWVKQSWNCSDGIEGLERNDFTGTAYLKTNLKCGKPLSLDLHDSEGSVTGTSSGYNCTLNDTTTDFAGYSPEAPVSMPHTSYSKSCTMGSIINTTSLSLQKYEISELSSGTKVGTFSLFNPGSGDTYHLFRIPVQDDGAWHECNAADSANSEPYPWQLVGCRYSLDRKSHRISFQIQWYCDDRDPSHAILFDATAGTAVLPAEKCDDAKSSCRLPIDGTAEVAMPVSSLTWTSLSGPMDRGPILPWI
ncbi:hypothetical protein QBC37DRAFT_442656 [Rhypophila decipiens]|uniref:Uncharacterized protein n=1 Tax=Rhypophila decipiens TaxID=261697 RepID=A0AAN6Y171_9PEZI|nr:hypothetical protein QBC37DRAFT_442656 [Rhypophila decipiens]